MVADVIETRNVIPSLECVKYFYQSQVEPSQNNLYLNVIKTK